MRKKWLSFWQVALILGFLIHLAGLVLVIPIAMDTPDLGTYYVAAWAVRNGISPYDWDTAVRAAREADFFTAPSGLPYVYPPLLAYLLVPLSFLPYVVVQLVWTTAHLILTCFSAKMLSNLLRSPVRLSLIAIITFSPFTLGLGTGNVGILLLPGILGLAMAVSAMRYKNEHLLVYILMGILKLFPISWLFVPLVANLRKVVKKALALLLVFVILIVSVNPTLMLDFPRALLSHSLNDSTTMLEQHNLWALLRHLALPTDVQYHRFFVNVERHWSPLIPLSSTDLTLLQYAVAGVGLLLTLIVSWKLVRGQEVLYALWFLAIGVLLFQPFTLYHYLIITLPAMLSLVAEPDTKLKTTAALVYILIGLGRFSGLLSAVLPYPLGLIGTHAGTAALFLLLVGLYAHGFRKRPYAIA